MMETILIIDDKDSIVQMLRETLSAEGYEIEVAYDGAVGITMARELKPDLVITDLKLPRKSGLEVLKAVKANSPMMPVIVMTGYGTVEIAVEAMKLGAFEFITKPLDTDYLQILISRALANQRLVTENILLKYRVAKDIGIPDIIGGSQVMVDVAVNIQKVSATRTTALLQGESGTGKELFARAIHDLSPRHDHPFVPINCAAIPRELLESELFGHEKGSFTGAGERKLGKIELADKGTVFLDEIGEMDMSLQAKILRVIQEGEIDRVGGSGAIKVDIRIITATNRDLETEVRNGRFREDLYYRINVFPVHVPPLRERSEDIPILVEHFLVLYTAEMNLPMKKVAKDAMEMLKRYEWKGNVRELENVVERALILCEGDTITKEDLRITASEGQAGSKDYGSGTLEEVSKAAQKDAESRRIRAALVETGGNKSRASELLKVSYKTLLTKIKDYGI
ncbi:sigma-54-dependent Fis family transcriptional regulator [bacterium]|nr:sigma-54-dependent Fis family transcriptional regulator [bacterium]